MFTWLTRHYCNFLWASYQMLFMTVSIFDNCLKSLIEQKCAKVAFFTKKYNFYQQLIQSYVFVDLKTHLTVLCHFWESFNSFNANAFRKLFLTFLKYSNIQIEFSVWLDRKICIKTKHICQLSTVLALLTVFWVRAVTGESFLSDGGKRQSV